MNEAVASPAKPALFAVIEGVPVFHVYKNGYADGRITNFHFTLSDQLETYDDYIFDVRDLGCHPQNYEPGWLENYEEQCKAAIGRAIRSGRLQPPATS